MVYEQVLIAALDEGQVAVAQGILTILYNRFGQDSLRVQRLEGMLKETRGDFTAANQQYRAMLSADATNVLALKRAIAVLKSQGKIAQAIQELVLYLDTQSNDFEAWLELSHLYLGMGNYEQAAFCQEELILQQPANPFFHQMYAETQYTMGRWDVSLKEFLRVVELQTDSVRGFVGVKLVAERILVEMEKGKTKGWVVAQRATLERLSQLAAERLVKKYADTADQMAKEALELWL